MATPLLTRPRRPLPPALASERDAAADAVQYEIRDLLRAILAELTRQSPPHGPRDAADVRVLLEIHRAAEGLPFKASSVLRRAERVPALAEALEGADIDSPKQLGKLLARLEGVVVDGVRLTRRPVRRGAFLWQVLPV